MRGFLNILWLGIKKLRSVFTDVIMVAFIVYSFSFSIYQQASGLGEDVNNASIAIVDEDHSTLSRRLEIALYPPYFSAPHQIEASDVEQAMNQGLYMFVLSIPPDFERDVRKGLQPEIQINIDATAVVQASLGAGYIQNIVNKEVLRFASRNDEEAASYVELVLRRAFNPSGTQSWFNAVVGLLDQLTMLVVILTGAALLREREHGTIEHLLVMPLNAFQIVLAKVWANGLIILVAFSASMIFVVEGLLDVPFAGSRLLLLAGTVVYLFAAAAIGIFLGTIAKTMAQFALLMLMVILPMMMLSGGMSPVESQPDIVQPFTWLLPSRHYMSFSQAVIFRGAGLDVVWPEFLTMAVLGSVVFVASLFLFRWSISVSK